MKIVKEFYDPIYGEKVNCRNWIWGLGDDGNVYRRISDIDNWNDINGPLPTKISLREMKMLVKEFGHLVIFT